MAVFFFNKSAGLHDMTCKVISGSFGFIVRPQAVMKNICEINLRD